MTELIVIRHAKSLSNEAGIFTGNLDLDLSEYGRAQADLLADYLICQNIHVDKIYSSDLIRALHTIEPYAKRKGMEIVKSKALREIYAGEWEGKKFDELQSVFSETYKVWKSDISKVKCDGGESVSELFTRVNSEIDRIASDNDGKTLIIVTHATPLRSLIARACGKGLDGLQNVKWGGNASLNFFEYEGGELRAVRLDVCEHLGDIQSKLPSNV